MSYILLFYIWLLERDLSLNDNFQLSLELVKFKTALIQYTNASNSALKVILIFGDSVQLVGYFIKSTRIKHEFKLQQKCSIHWNN